MYLKKKHLPSGRKKEKPLLASSGGEMNCTSGHICSKNLYSIKKETLVLPSLM